MNKKSSEHTLSDKKQKCLSYFVTKVSDERIVDKKYEKV